MFEKLLNRHIMNVLCKLHLENVPLHKKRSFLLKISSVNVTKSAVSCGYCGIFNEEILNEKLHFLCSVPTVQPIHIPKQIAQETFLILKFYV